MLAEVTTGLVTAQSTTVTHKHTRKNVVYNVAAYRHSLGNIHEEMKKYNRPGSQIRRTTAQYRKSHMTTSAQQHSLFYTAGSTAQLSSAQTARHTYTRDSVIKYTVWLSRQGVREKTFANKENEIQNRSINPLNNQWKQPH